jgi:hypothetical protein
MNGLLQYREVGEAEGVDEWMGGWVDGWVGIMGWLEGEKGVVDD